MSVILTTRGVQVTLGFHEDGDIGARTGIGDQDGISAKVDRNRIVRQRDRVTALPFNRVPRCLMFFLTVPPGRSSAPPVCAENFGVRKLGCPRALLGLSIFSNISIACGPAKSLFGIGQNECLEMSEGAFAREYHGKILSVAGLNQFLVFNGASRLYYRRHSFVCNSFDVVHLWQEAV